MRRPKVVKGVLVGDGVGVGRAAGGTGWYRATATHHPSRINGIVVWILAGMMVFVAIDELLPAARRYQTDKHQVVYGLIAGFTVVALSLLLL